MARPMLGDLELEQVQLVETDEDQVITRHPVPGLEGDFLQELGRRGARLRLAGVLTRPETQQSLAELRTRFHAGDPVAFVSDISTATLVDDVLIEQMDVRELAGRPSSFEYDFALREFTEPERVDTEEVILPPPPEPEVETGKLSVTVVVEGDPAFDMDRVRVTVRGTDETTLAAVDRTLAKRISANVWFEEPIPAGDFTVEALVDDTKTVTGQREVLTGSAQVRVQNGPVTSVTIVLRRGAKVGTVFVITFTYDKAFVEPCMRHVLQQVAKHAEQHRTDERLLVIGHTDLTGPDEYNQSLSERRARATYAVLTFGHDPQKSVAEWNELRRARPAGEIKTVKDTWGTREIQHILQDLGQFKGNVGKFTGDDAVLTDAAIKQFQRDHGLADDGVVGDDTWPVLIEAYLGHDPVDVPTEQFLPNANQQGCDHGPLRWIGCGEQDPVSNINIAWRPNRRTELMFVTESELLCQVPEPITLGLVPDGAGGGGWCLDDGTATTVDCFVVPIDPPPDGPPNPNQWLRKPAEPGSFPVTGTITFEDGTAFTGKYVLTAPDGEYMNGEVPTTSNAAHAGTPNPGKTDGAGKFVHAKTASTDKGPGTFGVEVDGPFLARTRTQSLADAKGNAVCFRLDGSAPADIVVVDRAVAAIQPSITGPDAVVVRKPHTNPARQPVVLRASTAFTGAGTFTRSSDRIRFFDAAAGGNEITFNGTDNVFTDAQLAAGHTVFADGFSASAAVNDVTLTLALRVNGTPGLAATKTMTSVELTLDIGLSRPAAGVEPPLMGAAAKAVPGRPLQAQTAGRDAERAVLVVSPPQPAGFTGDLIINTTNGQLRLFATEVPSAGDVALGLPHRMPAGGVPAGGARLFVEGVTASPAPGDAGIQLGIDGVDPDGDRVVATVVQLEAADDPAVAAPPATFVRVGLWDGAFDPVTGALLNGVPAATNFVDLDPRNFHFRVRDPRRAGEVAVGWRTEFDDGTADDNRAAPNSDQLTLTETAAGSTVFVSRAVMLVADQVDRDQRVNSGLPPGHPDAADRAFGASNHRLRRITVDATHQLISRVVATYPALAGVNPFALRLPVFQRNPEDRRRIRVHLVNLRDRVGGAGILTAARQRDVEANIRAAYAACGIYADIDVIALDPPASAAGWVAAYPTDPLAANPSVEAFTFPGGVNLVPSTSQADVITAVRALPAFAANDIYIVMVRHIYQNPVPAPPGPGLADASGGAAFPDSWTAAGAAARGFAFVSVDRTNTLADPHEMTHITTDLRNVAGGHFDLGAAAAAAPGPIDGKNLMQRFTLIVAGTSSSKRVWDQAFTNTVRVPNLVIPAQITAIRAARFVLPY